MKTKALTATAAIIILGLAFAATPVSVNGQQKEAPPENKIEIVVQDADNVWEISMESPPEELIAAASAVAPRAVVEYADSLYCSNLKSPPAELITAAKTIAPRMTVEYADSLYCFSLSGPPSELTKTAAKMAPRIVIEYADSNFIKPLIPPSWVPSPPPSKPSELVFKLSLDSGLNMVSLPLKPEIDFTARTFAEELGATTVISYNTAKDKFVPFVPEVFSGDGFLIEGGKGYIVNLLESKDVVFTGTGWSNTTAAPSKDKSWHPGRSNSFGTTWAFVITGTVFDEDGEPLEDAPLYSVVENPQDHKKVSCLVGKLEESKFAIPLVDMNHKAVVSAGEPLKVYIQDTAGNIVSGPITHRISVEEIKRGYAKFNLRLGDVIPEKSALLQNYPNPFNPETWIPYQLANRSSVTISIYNLSGKMVRTLNIGKREAGLYLSKGRAAYWDGKDSLGQSVASGVYFYTIKADDFSATRKMILVK